MTPRFLRTLGLMACLTGALTMIAARFSGRLPPDGIWVGLGVILFGWALFALSSIRRARGSTVRR
jgi:ABC-type Fe3+-siderophore transport system permease subunit